MRVRKANNAAIVGFIAKLAGRTRTPRTAAGAVAAPIDQRTKLSIVASVVVVHVLACASNARVVGAQVAVVALGIGHAGDKEKLIRPHIDDWRRAASGVSSRWIVDEPWRACNVRGNTGWDARVIPRIDARGAGLQSQIAVIVI